MCLIRLENEIMLCSKSKKEIILLGILFASIIFQVTFISSSNFEESDISKKKNPLENGWKADEDTFERGLAIPQSEKKSSKSLLPEASHFASSPIASTIRLIVILVKFSDYSNTLAKSAIQSKVFGASNSLKSYYYEVTYGHTTIIGDVTDWLTLPNTREYYGRDSATGNDDYYGSRSRYFTDSLNVADPFVNFANYDKVLIVHAGNDQAQSGENYDLWSCALFPYYGPYWNHDSVPIYTASCLAELEEIGTYAHEFGHQNNLPDLYDTTGSNIHYTDKWDLMDNGNWNGNPIGSSPAHLTGYCRSYLGLIPENKTKVISTNGAGLVTLDALETGGSNYLLVKIPLSDENHYYLIEARFKIGYDAGLPDEGVLITKIDNTKSTGNGIVTMMDAVSSTETKNDGAYDHASENEYGAFHDLTNNIHIIVKSKGTNTYTILVIRASLSYSSRSIAKSQETYFLLDTLYPGQEVFWDWKRTSGGSYNLDCFIKKDGSGDYEHSEDVDHDSGVFKVTSEGTYTFHIRNENSVYGATYDIYLYTLSKPNTKFESVIINPSSIYRNQYFTLQVQIRNEGASTDTSYSLTPNLPSQIHFVSGETALRTKSDLIYWESFTASWQLYSDQSGGPFTIDIQCVSTYNGTSHYYKTISITIDTINPTLNLISPSSGSIFNVSSVLVQWSGSDAESGLKEFKIYVNNTYNGTSDNIYDMDYVVSNLSSGFWNITVEAKDFEGNGINRSVVILVDRVNPVIGYFNPMKTWISSNMYLSFNGSISDALSGLDTMKILMKDGSGVWQTLTTRTMNPGAFELSLYIGSITGSTVQFKLWLKDKAGNSIESTIKTVNIDNQVPSIPTLNIESNSETAGEYSGMIILKIYATDAGSGVASVGVEIRGPGFSFQDDAIKQAEYYEFGFDSSDLIEKGNVEVTITVTDNIGNSYQNYRVIYVNNFHFNIMDYLPYIIGVGALIGAAVGSLFIMKGRRDPIDLRNKYEKKKTAIENKKYQTESKLLGKNLIKDVDTSLLDDIKITDEKTDEKKLSFGDINSSDVEFKFPLETIELKKISAAEVPNIKSFFI